MIRFTNLLNSLYYFVLLRRNYTEKAEFSMDSTKVAYIKLHIAVLLFGLTAILGAKIQLAAVELVWWRVLITSVSLLFLIQFGAQLKLIPRKYIFQFLGIGIIIALHWICFFGAIKLSNASITLVCMATQSFFTALTEPLVLKERIKGYELMLGLMMIPGMLLVVNGVSQGMLLGIGVGLLSAFFGALFTSFNKKLVHVSDSKNITFLELTSAWVFITLLLPFFRNTEIPFLPQGNDWWYLIVLALLCTTLAFVLALQALEYISAFASNLIVNLEPVYGIILAVFLLKENKDLSLSFYAGVVVILSAIFLYPFLKKKFSKAL